MHECKNCPISTNSKHIFFNLIALRMNNVRLNFISFCTYFVGLGVNVRTLAFSYFVRMMNESKNDVKR